MTAVLLVAALTVTTAPGVDCPGKDEIEARLHALGVSVRNDDDVRVHFAASGTKRAVAIDVAGAPQRTLEHDGADCSSLGDATVALLSVLLDDRPAPEAPRAPAPETSRAFRVEAAALVSSGLVASPAIGAEIALRWKPARVASLVVGASTWPAREHGSGQGSVTVGATLGSLGACAGPSMGRFTIEGCLLGFAGIYSLSAAGYPIVHPASRVLAGGELALRASFAITFDLAIFLRGGGWLPLHPIDATVRGGAAPFAMAPFGPEAALGGELGF